MAARRQLKHLLLFLHPADHSVSVLPNHLDSFSILRKRNSRFRKSNIHENPIICSTLDLQVSSGRLRGNFPYEYGPICNNSIG